MPTLIAVPNPAPNGDGSELTPYGAQEAIDKARPGDTVLLRGIFNEPIRIKADYHPDAPLTIAGHEDGAIFDGQFTWPRKPANGAFLKNPKTGDIAHYVPMVAVQGSHVVVRGLKVRNSLGRGIGVGKVNEIIEGVTIQDCFTDWSRGAGINVNDTTNLRIISCVVQHSGCFMQERRPSSQTNWPVACAVVRCEDVTIDGVISTDNWGEGLAVGRGTRYATVINGVFAHNMALQLYFNRCADSQAYYNLIYGTDADASAGLVVNNEDMKEPPCRNLVIAHNIAVGNQYNYAIWGNAAGNDGSEDVLFAFNTSALGKKAAWRMLRNQNKNIRYIGNLTYQPDGNFQDGNEPPADWHLERNAWSAPRPPAYLRGDGDVYDVELINPVWPSPLLGATPGHYAPAADYAVGPLGGIPARDYFGNDRKTWTAGAVEYQSTQPPQPADEIVRLLVSTQMSPADAAALRALLAGKSYTVELA